MDENVLAVVVVDGALAVHKALGPGLLESVYVAALAIELTERRLNHEREVAIPPGTAIAHSALRIEPI